MIYLTTYWNIIDCLFELRWFALGGVAATD